jgi:cytochrome c peroxidase
MFMADNTTAFYDAGFYNIGTRPTTEDIARAGSSPFGFPLSYTELALMRNQLPESVRRWVPNLPAQCADGLFVDEVTGLCTLPAPVNNRIAVRGAFKSPSLRNGEFSGPYLHNGADATLRQVMDFYIRGSNFPATNFNDMDPDMGGILELDPTAPGLTAEQRQAAEDRIKALVAFLANGLTDDRVRYEQAPFDHPQLIVFDGSRRNPRQEIRMRIPAVGRNGRFTPIPRFLDLDPQAP